MLTRPCLFYQVQGVVFFPCSFTAVIGKPVGIVCASISVVFLISNGILKMFLKTIRWKETNTEKFVYWLELN